MTFKKKQNKIKLVERVLCISTVTNVMQQHREYTHLLIIDENTCIGLEIL